MTAEASAAGPAQEDSPLRAALEYIDRGWAPIPVPYGQKGPKTDGWRTMAVTRENASRLFGGKTNVGVRLGEASGLDRAGAPIDLDLDCAEAVRTAAELLAVTVGATGMVFGRQGSPRSHYIYSARRPPQKASTKFTDPGLRGDEATIVEVRSVGGQTVFPASVHPSGERVRWYEHGEPAEVEADALLRAAGAVSAAVILTRRWHDLGGSHNDAVIRLAGALARGGWTEEEATALVTSIVRYGGDGEVQNRLSAVHRTYVRHEAGEPVYGTKDLFELYGNEQWLRHVVRDLGLANRGGGGGREPAATAGTSQRRPGRRARSTCRTSATPNG